MYRVEYTSDISNATATADVKYGLKDIICLTLCALSPGGGGMPARARPHELLAWFRSSTTKK